MPLPSFAMMKDAAARMRGGPVWRGGPQDVVLALDGAGVIHEASASVAEVIGAAGGISGRSLYDFVRREDRAAVRAAVEAACGGEAIDDRRMRAEFRLLRMRRAPAFAEITLRPDGPGRAVALIRDLGARLDAHRDAKAASEAAPANDAAAAATGYAAAAADLAHELKNPLNAIMGRADAMAQEVFGPLGDDKYAEYAALIRAAGAHMSELIDAMLDQAKIEAGRFELALGAADAAALASAAGEMIRLQIEDAGVAYRLEAAPGLPPAMLDARIVRQILLNLLSNAAKFTDAGEISLRVEQVGDDIVFTVTDSGKGMDKITLAKAGGRFSDVASDGVNGARSNGLGLSLSYRLARLHGGSLHLDSAPGAGTTARLTLPIRGPAAEPVAGAHVNGRGAAAPDVQSQLDRVAAFRRERAASAA